MMKGLFEQQPIAFLTVKIGLSLLLYLLLYLDKVPHNKRIYSETLIGAFSFTVILCLHGSWIFAALV